MGAIFKFLGGFFSQAKAVLAAVIGGALVAAYSWFRIVKTQRDQARVEAAQQAKRAASVEEKFKTHQGVAKATAKAQQEAREVERENQTRHDSGTRPSGDFGDRRLRDDP